MAATFRAATVREREKTFTSTRSLTVAALNVAAVWFHRQSIGGTLQNRSTASVVCAEYNSMPFRVFLRQLIIALFIWSEANGQSIAGEHSAYQDASKQVLSQGGTIRINTSMVLVPVSVTDATGRAVTNLRLEDFTVLENGSPVTLEHLGEPGLSRLDLVLVFDVTGSTRPRFDFEQEAATSFLKSLFRAGDAISILCIASEPRILLERTESLAAALNALGQLRPSGAATAFFDSVITATQLLRSPLDSDTRRVMVVVSDGEENLSTMKLPDALRGVQQSDCIFYSINPGGPSIRLNKVSLRGQQWMESIAEPTGGVAFLAENPQDLANIYKRIAAELQAQYLISYYSPDPRADGSFHSIAVKVPAQPGFRVRARQGYYAGKMATH
jgi:Ca-activated chloride channel homolog